MGLEFGNTLLQRPWELLGMYYMAGEKHVYFGTFVSSVGGVAGNSGLFTCP
jgi:hypothetical protein